MQGWRLGFLGIEAIPAWRGEFEIEQFFRLSAAEISTVKTRRGVEMQLGAHRGDRRCNFLTVHEVSPSHFSM